MANSIREVLTVANLPLTLFCGNMSRVGFGITGTWTGTLAFSYSQDAVNFIPLSVTPFPPVTGLATQQSTTANGNFEAVIRNALAVRITPTTLLTGAPVVTIAGSIDSSYQDAFLAATSKYVNQAASGATNTVTIAAQANRAWRLRTLSVTVQSTATWASSPNVQVVDGSSNILWAGDLPTTAGITTIPLPADQNIPGLVTGGVVGTPGNQMQIIVASGAGAVKTNINGELVAA